MWQLTLVGTLAICKAIESWYIIKFFVPEHPEIGSITWAKYEPGYKPEKEADEKTFCWLWMILPLLSSMLIFHGGCDVKMLGITVTLPSSPVQLVFSVIKFDWIHHLITSNYILIL